MIVRMESLGVEIYRAPLQVFKKAFRMSLLIPRQQLSHEVSLESKISAVEKFISSHNNLNINSINIQATDSKKRILEKLVNYLIEHLVSLDKYIYNYTDHENHNNIVINTFNAFARSSRVIQTMKLATITKGNIRRKTH